MTFNTVMVNLLDLREITIQNYIVSFKQEESGRTILSQIHRRGSNLKINDDVKSQKGNSSDIYNRYTDAVEVILHGEFKTPESVNSPPNEFINLGMIIINLSNTTTMSESFRSDLTKLFESILSKAQEQL